MKFSASKIIWSQDAVQDQPYISVPKIVTQGLLVDLSKKAMITGNYKELDDAIRMKIPKWEQRWF